MVEESNINEQKNIFNNSQKLKIIKLLKKGSKINFWAKKKRYTLFSNFNNQIQLNKHICKGFNQ